MEQSDEPNGFLRTADKNWILGETDYDHQSTRSQRKREIREHFKAAMEDFSLLMNHWDRDQLQMAFEELRHSEGSSTRDPTDIDNVMNANKDPEEWEGNHAVECVRNMVALSYIGLSQIDADLASPEAVAHQALEFHRATRRGIRDGKKEFGQAPEAVLLASNVPLWELPSPEEFTKQIDYDDVGEKNDIHQAREGTPDYYISKDVAGGDYYANAIASIGQRLYSRKRKANVSLSEFHLQQ
ncbi:hypothetical protein [Halobellus rarus]|uniref:Domain of unknown function domain-containing protein n=1 Tax=Halobellus rarus TaxID=1126237 RepID=A0ABD6CVL0_9EURY|nr:hypothetical protein [Halobellus rarus]